MQAQRVSGMTFIWYAKKNLAKANNFGVKKTPNELVLVHLFPRLSTKIAKSL